MPILSQMLLQGCLQNEMNFISDPNNFSSCMNIALLPNTPLYIGYGDRICKKLAILYTSGASPSKDA
jgi:hypothetical protein